MIEGTSIDNVIDIIESLKIPVDSIYSTIRTEEIITGSRIEADAKTSFWVSFIAMVFGILAAIFGFLGYWYQRKTMKNTDKVSMTVQKAQFRDLTRHLYRNIICTLAMSEKYFIESDRGRIFCYPSEEHFLKLRFLSDETVHLEKYLNNEKVSSLMHKFTLQTRNYDTEIEVILGHMKQPTLRSDVKKRDLDVLKFKPLILMESILQIEAEADANERRYSDEDYGYLLERTISEILESHITNVMRKVNSTDWDRYRFTNYISGDGTGSFGIHMKNFLKDYKYISRNSLLDFLADRANPAVSDYLNGSSVFDNLWKATSDEQLREMITSEEIDILKLLSILISVDVYMERNVINIIIPEHTN